MPQLIHRIALKNLLSFDGDGIDLPLRPLNVLIGPNGSGKSNLIEALSLLQSAPGDMAENIRDGGGISDWLWKGEKRNTPLAEALTPSEAALLGDTVGIIDDDGEISDYHWREGEQPTAAIGVLVDNPRTTDQKMLRHAIVFTESSQRFEIGGEMVSEQNLEDSPLGPLGGLNDIHFFSLPEGNPILNVAGEDEPRKLYREDFDRQKSILAQRKDPDQYPEITYLGEEYSRIRIFREWSFGRNSPTRQPQRADQRNDFLAEDCSNLGLVLNTIRQDFDAKNAILENLKNLYPEVEDFDVIIQGGTVQVFLQEGKFNIPATRLSDGTLRYLCLLAILCHPKPPPLICIEEPELGLHPDVLVSVGKLLKEASKRTQLIVTTHSEVLVDCMSDDPADVIVCDKIDSASQMRRLENEELKAWLEKYSLGQLWRRGEIGGNRW